MWPFKRKEPVEDYETLGVCDFCTGRNPLLSRFSTGDGEFSMLMEGDFDGRPCIKATSRINEGSPFHARFYEVYKDINYCPMCGRKLRKRGQ